MSRPFLDGHQHRECMTNFCKQLSNSHMHELKTKKQRKRIKSSRR